MNLLCRVCGDDGLVDEGRSTSTFARYRRLLGPKWRPVPWGFQDFICWRDLKRAEYQVRALEAARLARVAAMVLVA